MRSLRQIVEQKSGVSADEAAEYGITRKTFTIIRLLDTRTDRRWFLRDHEELGAVESLAIDGAPLDTAEVLAFVRREYGADASVLY